MSTCRHVVEVDRDCSRMAKEMSSAHMCSQGGTERGIAIVAAALDLGERHVVKEPDSMHVDI